VIPDRLRTLADLERLLARTTNYEERMPAGALSRVFDLSRMEALLASVGDPHVGPTTVHLAGSKGKGSTARMVASILLAAGASPVGLYVSPHLEHLTERATVDDEPLPGEEWAAAAETLLPHLAATEGTLKYPTFFELLTAAALVAFRRRRVDWLVLETGLGGRLDATNVCRPAVTAITAIEREHTAILGDTVEEIAAEKAGILKAGVPVVSGVPAASPAARVVEEAAARVGAPLHRLGVEIVLSDAATANGPWTTGRVAGPGRAAPLPVALRVAGAHQARNAALAVAIARLLRVPDPAIAKGLAAVSLPARMEPVLARPILVVDAAHTPESAAAAREALDACFEHRRVHLLVGMLEEKDVTGVLSALLPRVFRVVCCGVPSPRGMDPARLAEVARTLTKAPVVVATDAAAALRDSFQHALANDAVLVSGSTYLAGAARSAARAYPGFLPRDPDPRPSAEVAAP
jgi:dihydrofolate synthase/folylpolyglutamate synthase